MEIIREPLDVDFYVENRGGLSKEEEKLLSAYIRASKAKTSKQKTTRPTKKKKSSK